MAVFQVSMYGRFWVSTEAQDPIGFLSGDFNLYGYVANRPSAFTDPLGLDKQRRIHSLGIQVAAVFGGLNQGPAGRRGWVGQATYGIAYDPSTGTLQLFKSVGKTTPDDPEGEAVGIGVGLSIVYGQSFGRLDDFFGESTEYGESYLAISVTQSENAAGDPTGFSVGLGPGRGVSATKVKTTTVPVSPPFAAPWR